MRKIIVLGLDSAPPELVFGPWLADLPTLRGLVERGAAGPMRTCVPPITVPAWTAMMSSLYPGRLGLYGFRNRTGYGYDSLAVANATHVTVPRLWDHLSDAGLASILLSVPQTYPLRPLNGAAVSCFLTPEGARYTYPDSLAGEIESLIGRYLFDVPGFRTDDKPMILDGTYAMTDRRFRVARHLMATRPWDFFMMVEIGVDRMQHGFWKFMDPTHPKHEPGHRYTDVIRDYYRHLDGQIAELLDAVHGDATTLILSDHGARCMRGGVAINEWLIREGYLTLLRTPARPSRFDPTLVDWSATRAWAEGGYYGRVFLNVAGREPRGTIAPADYEAVRGELARKLCALPDQDGAPLATRAMRPEDVYPEVRGFPPDLIVYFDDLGWRAVASVGLGSVYAFDNDTGPDDANHAEHGIFIGANAPDLFRPGHRLEGLSLYDVAPTILGAFGLPVPPDMEGHSIDERRTR